MVKSALLILLLTAPAYGWLYRIAWDYDAQATFNIYRADNGGIPQSLDATSETLYIDETISEGMDYAYFVTAVDLTESNPAGPLDVASGWRGDANGDASVNSEDALLLAEWLSGNSAAVGRCADMDDNFRPDAVDAALLCRRLAW